MGQPEFQLEKGRDAGAGLPKQRGCCFLGEPKGVKRVPGPKCFQMPPGMWVPDVPRSPPSEAPSQSHPREAQARPYLSSSRH